MKQSLSLAISGLTALVLVSTSSLAFADRAEGRLLGNNNQPILLKTNNNKQNNKVIVNKNNNNKVIVNKNNNNKVIVKPSKNNKPVIIKPTPQPVIVKPAPKKVVVVKPAPKKVVVVQPARSPWYRPIMPGWNNWRGGKVVIVDKHHSHYNAFAFAMTAMAVAIVVDQTTNKPYTENGKPVTVKERSCGKNEETQVIDLDNELLVITCK